MNVVVVESPAKAKTINKYLVPDYTGAGVLRTRPRPAFQGRISVKPDEDFAMDWEVDAKAAKRLADIASALKGASGLILATDPDREGEAISWHVLEDLNRRSAPSPRTPRVQRVVFNAITKSAVTDRHARTRATSTMELVDAYLARRALDYLVGFTLSPVLWRKLPGARSAGRVQSVSLRLIVDREAEIEAFRTQEFWTVEADVAAGSDPFLARLVNLRRQDGSESFDLADEATRDRRPRRGAVRRRSASPPWSRSPASRTPPPPFTTSTLQQEGSRKLGFNGSTHHAAPRRSSTRASTSRGETVGLITYMRTDGRGSRHPKPSTEARRVIGERSTARPTFPSSRALSTRPRPRTRRRRTRRSARPRWRATPRPCDWRATWAGSTS